MNETVAPKSDDQPIVVTRDASDNPWLMLVYLVFVFVPLLFAPSVSGWSIALSILACALFIPIHFASWRNHRLHPGIAIASAAALGLLLLPFNLGGNTFVIYAMAMAGALLPAALAVRVAFLAWALMAVELLLVSNNRDAALAFSVMTAVIGGMVLVQTVIARLRARQIAQLQLSHNEVKRLAALAERERIARDLHDLLGHTLSVVVLKSELAGKLIDRDSAAARKQILEVEQVARKALNEVREAVSGFRSSGLAAELAASRLALLDADVRLDYQVQPVKIDAAVEATLALCLREAVTNVLRHAKASRVEVDFHDAGETLHLQISDDGRGGMDDASGNGLRGMRERLAAIGAGLAIESPRGGGSRLSICVDKAWQANAGVPA
mgnify:CR=1 FL=1